MKEVKLALKENYEVSVLCCEYSNWSKANNEAIKEELLHHIRYYPVSGDRTPLLLWLKSSFFFTVSAAVLVILPHHVWWLSVRSNKRSWLLMRVLKKIKGKQHLVIAHNPGSFYPAQLFATNSNIPFAIDIEDYHPGETKNVTEGKIMRNLCQAVLPKAGYVSMASPIIARYSNNDLKAPLQNELLVLNYFSPKEFVAPIIKDTNDPLTLLWFSQNISHGRGLEELIPVVEKTTGVLLHLYGNMDTAFYENWLKDKKNIVVHAALPQAVLHKELSMYDVGLALEQPASNLNRDLCLTNKMLAYYQAGLYILASSTSAQNDFIQTHPTAGQICELQPESLSANLQQMIAQKLIIRSNAMQRFNAASPHNWDSTSLTLSNSWKQLLF